MNRISALLLLLLGPCIALAQPALEKSLLWKVTGNGLENPSFLYGTMHVGDKRVYKFTKSVMPSFTQSQAFAMELDPEEADPGAVMNLMKIDSGKLEDMFTPSEWATLDSFMLSTMSTSIQKFNDFSPFFVYGILAQTKFKNQRGKPLDLYFHDEAQKSGKRMHGLETMEEQMNAMETMPVEVQKEMLLDLTKAKGESNTDLNAFMKCYTKGDLEGLAKLGESEEFGDAVEKALIYTRNHNMTERMIPLMKETSTFVAVGALHLPGEEGIINLLRKKGYQVEALR